MLMKLTNPCSNFKWCWDFKSMVERSHLKAMMFKAKCDTSMNSKSWHACGTNYQLRTNIQHPSDFKFASVQAEPINRMVNNESIMSLLVLLSFGLFMWFMHTFLEATCFFGFCTCLFTWACEQSLFMPIVCTMLTCILIQLIQLSASINLFKKSPHNDKCPSVKGIWRR